MARRLYRDAEFGEIGPPTDDGNFVFFLCCNLGEGRQAEILCVHGVSGCGVFGANCIATIHLMIGMTFIELPRQSLTPEHDIGIPLFEKHT